MSTVENEVRTMTYVTWQAFDESASLVGEIFIPTPYYNDVKTPIELCLGTSNTRDKVPNMNIALETLRGTRPCIYVFRSEFTSTWLNKWFIWDGKHGIPEVTIQTNELPTGIQLLNLLL